MTIKVSRTAPTGKPAKQAKPAKPHPDFPLFPHDTGRWAKKVRGKLCYFGPWSDPQAALEKWLAQKDDLLAGRTPRAPSDGLTLRDLVNRFLTAKRHLVDTRELSPRTWADYHASCTRVIEVFGRNRLVVDLATDDFERLRKSLAKTRGPVALGNEIQRIRVMLKYGYDAGLVDRPVRYGPTFKRPSKKVLRAERHKNGDRMFEAGDLRTIIASASQPLKSMVLLAVNCGYGNNDVGLLPISAIDLERGWVTFPRPKTAIKRRCPLWPETVVSINEWMAHRPAPKDEADAGLVFLTKYGQCWSKGRDLEIESRDGELSAKGNRSNPLSHEFRKLLNSLKLYRRGLSFYSLRHVFETVAGEAKDPVATSSIMGHADASMSAVYRERIGDGRLKAVVDHVRQWMLMDGRADEKAPNDGWTIG